MKIFAKVRVIAYLIKWIEGLGKILCFHLILEIDKGLSNIFSMVFLLDEIMFYY